MVYMFLCTKWDDELAAKNALENTSQAELITPSNPNRVVVKIS
jgi:hypothetical protein